MGRKPRFTEDDFLDAVLRITARDGAGAVTIAGVAAEVGAPVGSVYHRFASRDLLLARLWVRTIRRFQEPFVAAISDEDPVVGADRAVSAVLAWVRAHPAEAGVLLLYRRDDLVTRWPDELGPELVGLNDAAGAALRDYARARYGRAGTAQVERVTLALVDIPYAAVRRHLAAGRPHPASTERHTLAAARAVLAD
ncbi:TetR/AcrR family transcriptional regulator [Streptomyces sp. SID3343]|uniref:TetR/AcrR family transcriptional regulator n=1 Tax=Streptomyces sp. SID3343 TaxID=2690260 RepID=UPI00136B2B10|nr:TetR/AcrR family transcriptional regulator [Streptomyces sp. SID3343]MYW01943.1 TetR family transcriptional regulator [Streptomyces sp. SID3343]